MTLTDATPHQLTFSWTAVVHECPSVNYTLTTSSCGDCPSTIDTPTTTCRIQPGEPRTCIASVQAVVCDGILGEPSMASTFRLKGINNTANVYIYIYIYIDTPQV